MPYLNRKVLSRLTCIVKTKPCHKQNTAEFPAVKHILVCRARDQLATFSDSGFRAVGTNFIGRCEIRRRQKNKSNALNCTVKTTTTKTP